MSMLELRGVTKVYGQGDTVVNALRGIDLTAASARHDDVRGWGGRGVWVRGTGVLTGIAVRLCGEALKRFEGAVALAPGWRQCGWRRPYGCPVTWPRVMEQ